MKLRQSTRRRGAFGAWDDGEQAPCPHRRLARAHHDPASALLRRSGMGHISARLSKLAMVSLTLFVTGCGRLCAGGTPVEQIDCTDQGSATLSGADVASTPAPMILEEFATSISGGPFEFLFVGGYLSVQVTSSFPNGATTYSLPSPVVNFDASISLVDGKNIYDILHVVSGTIDVAAANDNALDVSGSLILGDDSGRTFTIADMTMHVACSYDETVCR
ncbi:MAG TPA: hypothetical protein VFG23_02535 [Polyangia bacterium]|nr:hypothetical protein [Polyangia bacterium]